ncbi:metallophosphoesterase family protein [Elongatibacter sediminis]|uniref:Metallophosphoesterase n=1 Tax=Elongatibacter sediminis TaxID=3119006 RepID=A0AAW9RPH8_9GAMM
MTREYQKITPATGQQSHANQQLQQQLQVAEQRRRAQLEEEFFNTEEFERRLLEVVHLASSRDLNDKVAEAIRERLDRLEKDPNIVNQHAEGPFTYDDAVLATSKYYHDQGIRAGVQGGNLAKWIATGVAALLNRDERDFIHLAGRTPTGPVVLDDKPEHRIAVIGDAGFRCKAQQRVVELMKAQTTEETTYDYVIHLGDTYFAGSAGEMLVNLLSAIFEMPASRRAALAGNHDLYFGPEPFMHALTILQQPGRYFCIEAGAWRIACLDTSLASATVLREKGSLDSQQVNWLSKLANSVQGRRLILMGHHPPISAHGEASEDLVEQIGQSVLRKTAAWYWGHEHRCIAYKPSPDGWVGSLVGNGVFQEARGGEPIDEEIEWEAQGTCTCYGSERGGVSDLPHGYMELVIGPNSLQERYILENDERHTRNIELQQ